jgi:hypothetical protein
MQGNFHQEVWYSIPRRENPAACRRRIRSNTWTPGGIAIDQVSTYKYPGVVYQEDGSWQAHAQKALAKMQAAMGTGGHTVVTAVCRQRSDCSWFRPSSTRGHGAEVWDTTKAVKDKMSAVVKKALRSILALHPRDCSSDVLYGDTTSTRCTH